MKAIRVTKYKYTLQTGGTYYQKGNRLIQWYFYRRFDEVLKLALEKISNETQTVGDFGCGWGYFLPTLSKSFRSVVALDYIQTKIESGRRWNALRELVNTELGDVENIHYINGDIQRLPFEDNVFDVLFVMSVLEHVSDAKKAIAELRRVLVERGVLIVGAPNEVGMANKIREFASIITQTERASSHKGYDWRNTEKELKAAFKIDRKIFVPFNLLRTLNPYVIIRCIKD